MDAATWLRYGVDQGFCSEAECNTHNGLPSTPEEAEEWEDGFDPCVPAVRLWL